MAAACAFKVFVGDFTDQYLDLVEQSYKGAEMKDLVSFSFLKFSFFSVIT